MGVFVCAELCLTLWAKLGICEHGVHNCDSGFREIDLCGKQTTWVLGFFTLLYSPRTKALRNQRICPKQSGRQELRQTARRLFSLHSEREDPLRPRFILFSTVPTPHNSYVLACLDTKLYLIGSDLHPDTQFSQVQRGTSHTHLLCIFCTLFYCM